MVTEDKMMGFIEHRYGTADPFSIAEKLDVDVRWVDMDDDELGKTQYILGRPFVFLSKKLQCEPRRYFIMAHELGHVILHADVASFYKETGHGDSKAEYEADQFAGQLLLRLYLEEHQQLPDTVADLGHEYGVPFG